MLCIECSSLGEAEDLYTFPCGHAACRYPCLHSVRVILPKLQQCPRCSVEGHPGQCKGCPHWIRGNCRYQEKCKFCHICPEKPKAKMHTRERALVQENTALAARASRAERLIKDIARALQQGPDSSSHSETLQMLMEVAIPGDGDHPSENDVRFVESVKQQLEGVESTNLQNFAGSQGHCNQTVWLLSKCSGSISQLL